MSYKDRLLPGLKLTSPQGDVFNALWAGDKRSASKKLGVFKYPGVNNPSIQDLGIDATEYPITLSFAGVDNDLTATAFFEALKQSGTWVIEHPSKGVLILQPVSFQESIEPIRSGDLTLFATKWLAVVDDENTLSAQQISAQVNAQNAVVESSSLDQLVNSADQSNAQSEQAIKITTEKNLAIYETTIKPLADTDPGVGAKSDSILRSIRKTIATSPIDLTVLGGQIQALISAPATLTDVTLQSLKVYESFIDKVISTPQNVADRTALNITLISEMFLVSGISSVNLISSTSQPGTRALALSNLELVSDLFDKVTNSLDEVQELFVNEFIKDQYFSQSNSFVDSLTMVNQTIAYLLTITFDLLIEKRFILKNGDPTIIICINEYGELGDNDEKFDFFIETNALIGSQVLYLEAGKELVVYV